MMRLIGLSVCACLGLLAAGCSESTVWAESAKPPVKIMPGAVASETAVATSQPAGSKAQMKREVAVYGAGCFWGVEETFRQTPGVLATEVGYAGGRVENPSYKQVCTDTTGHAEVVRVEFDPDVISFEKLTELFFKLHDPTQVNRQGPDVGSQYRSVIFYQSPEQQKTAEAVKARLDKASPCRRPIATQIVEATPFYRAEDYHQQYLAKRGLSNCHVPAP